MVGIDVKILRLCWNALPSMIFYYMRQNDEHLALQNYIYISIVAVSIESVREIAIRWRLRLVLLKCNVHHLFYGRMDNIIVWKFWQTVICLMHFKIIIFMLEVSSVSMNNLFLFVYLELFLILIAVVQSQIKMAT